MSDELENSYIDTLKQKYLKALRDMRDAVRLGRDAERRRDVYGSTLKEEGEELPSLTDDRTALLFPPDTFQHGESESSANGNGHDVKPLSDTHALYLTIRKFGNKGYTFRDLANLTELAGYNLSEERVQKIYWKQVREERMRKTADGKVFLTPDGEVFNRFRVPKYQED
jgi:hypothetical protein